MRPWLGALVAVLLGTVLWWLATLRAARRRRTAEDRLRAQNAMLAGLVEASDAFLFSLDRELRYTTFNGRHAALMQSMFGAEIAPGVPVLDALPAEAHRAEVRAFLERALAGEDAVRETWLGPVGARRFFRTAYRPLRGAGGEVLGVAVLGQDLTDQKLSEQAIRRMNRELRALTSSNKTLLRATDERSLLQEVCRIIVEEAGYRMAWVGTAGLDEARRITPVAQAGVDDGYLAAGGFTWADTERGRGPSGRAIRTGATACAQDFATDPAIAPWRDEALRRGFRSSAALPLRDASDRTFGVLCIYSHEPNAFTPDERRLLEELAADVSVGVDLLRARAELERAEAQRAAHLHFLESMDRVNRAIASATDLEAMMRDVLEVVLSILRCDRAFLMYPCDPDAPAWSVPVQRTRPEYPGVAAPGVELPMDPEMAEALRILLASDAPVKFGPGTAQQIAPVVSERFGFQCSLSMALRPKVGKAWHFGVHQCSHVRVWTVDEEWLLQEVGRRLADALSTLLVVRDLRESEARLEKAERMAHLGYWQCTLDPARAGAGRVELSEEACRIFGFAPEERAWELGAWLERTRSANHPADRERADRILAEAMAEGRPGWDDEIRILRPDGEVRWLHGRGEITRDASGRPTRLLGTVLDVTDRKRAEEALRRSEEQYRRIVETAHEGIWVTDRDARTTFVNRQLAQMLGYSVEELQRVPLAELLDEEDAALFGPAVERPRAARAEQRELRLTRKDGSDLWALVELTPLYDDAGYGGALAMVTDVTERRAIEAQLRQSQKLEAVGRLAGGVAHDFNNLLTAILSDAQVLAEGLGPDNPLRTEATEIEAAARRAALLTRQLLAFGRKQRSEPQVVDVAEVMTAMDRMLRRLIGEDVELTTSVTVGLGRIRVDPVQLEQVLLNLAVNARDAMPRGGRLTIEARNVDGPGPEGLPPSGGDRAVMVGVRDTGVGMSAEVQAHLFEPFFTTKEPGKGTGLGLATVYGIVKQAGGEVRVRSEPNKGTSFEIFFPRFDGAAEPSDAPAPRELPRGSGTVLVVEDEPLVRALAVRVLRGAGYQVLDAGDAAQALAAIDAGLDRRIDLLLTDVVMPRVSGPELAQRLRARFPELPVLFASGYMDRMQDVQGQLGRRTGFIPKPFTPDELACKVRDLIGRGDDGARATGA